MYLAIDIGATKTFVATLTNEGVIVDKVRFLTAKDYAQFRDDLADAVAKMSTNSFVACGVGVPGRLDRKHGVGIAMGNLPWKNVPIRGDVGKLISSPVVIENDAKLAGLSEAMLLKDEYDRILYVTIGTGIGVGIITDQTIDPAFVDSESGKMPLEHQGKMIAWEDFASGRALKQLLGKQVGEITDPKDWQLVAHNIALGLINLIAMMQPQVIVLGGGVSVYYEHFRASLEAELAKYEVPLVPIPPIREAARPEDAVLYGCYDLAKVVYGKAPS